ncbi:MAG: glycerophosphodiester phosphodiesterase family protein [Ferrimicrobium sp.]
MGEAPASSRMAMDRAERVGVDGLELDLHSTSDHRLVVLHDDRLDLSTNATGAVHDWSLAQLKETVNLAGVDEVPAPCELQVQTIDEVLDAYPSLLVNLDIKEDLGPDSWIEEVLATAIYSYDALDRVIVASFHDGPLARIRERWPQIRTSASSAEALLWYQGFSEASQHVYAFNALQLPQSYLGFEYLSQELVAYAHACGVWLHVWTVDDSRDMQRLIAMGVDGIITNVPEVAVGVCRG